MTAKLIIWIKSMYRLALYAGFGAVLASSLKGGSIAIIATSFLYAVAIMTVAIILIDLLIILPIKWLVDRSEYGD